MGSQNPETQRMVQLAKQAEESTVRVREKEWEISDNHVDVA
jgi:hypothetical protein